MAKKIRTAIGLLNSMVCSGEQHTDESLKVVQKGLGELEEIIEIIARNLVAWDTSRDKSHGLLPEVYLSNKHMYKQLTGKDYNFIEVCKQFKIGS